MPDPEVEIRGARSSRPLIGGGEGSGLRKNFFRPFRPHQFGLNIREGPGPPGLLPWIRHCLISKPLSQLWSSLFSFYELLMSFRMDLITLSVISLFMCLIIFFMVVLKVNANWNSDVNMQMAFKMLTVPCFLSIASVDKPTCRKNLIKSLLKILDCPSFQGNLAKWNVFSTMEERVCIVLQKRA